MIAQITLFPDQASTLAPEVDSLYSFIIGITVAISTATAIVLIYFTIKYRRRSEMPAQPIEGSLALEIIWSVIPLGIVIVMFVWSSRLYFRIIVPPEDAIDVYVVGRQWMWKCQHFGGQQEINELHVPVNQPVRLKLTSEDVIHDFYVPDFRVKQDAVPGRYSTLWFEATKPGRFRLYCAEYCGKDHAQMAGWVIAQDPRDHERWLSQRADRSLALRGRQLFLRFQCVSCHSADARARAPILEGIYRQPVRLQDGSSVIADDDYLRESILNPRAKIVAGYDPIMPTFQGQMSEEELLQLIAFIRALKPGETPSRNEAAEPPPAAPKTDDKGRTP